MFEIHPIPAFDDNYIWLLQPANSRKVAVVDPGDSAPVMAYLQQHKLTLDAILVTHHHQDHTGGISTLLKHYPVPVYGPHSTKIPEITHPLESGDTVNYCGEEFAVLEVPGHTLDHIAYYCERPESALLFCGDTLFAAGCGRLFEGTPEQMLRSLNTLAALPGHTEVYCTHEYTLANLAFAQAVEADNSDTTQRRQHCQQLRNKHQPTLPSTIAIEQLTNPFLRCSIGAVRSAVGLNSGVTTTSDVETFALLRKWKDHFVA